MADVKVTIGTDTTAFNAGLDSARGKAQAFGSSVVKLGGIIATYLSVNAIRGFLNELDRIGKTATAFGATAESIQRIDAASKIAGTSLESVARAMFRLNGEAASGKAAESIAKLGMTTAEFLALPMEQQISVVAGAMDKLPSIQEKIALGYDLFGRRAQEIMPLLLQGQQNLNAEFEKTDTVSEATIRKVEMFNDAITRFTTSLKALAGSALGPVLDGLDMLSQAAGVVFVMTGRMTTALGQSLQMLKSGDFSGAAKSFSGAWENALDDVRTAMYEMDVAKEQALEGKGRGTMSAEAAAALEDAESGGGSAAKEIDAAKEIAKIEEESARRRLSLESQIAMLRDQEAASMESDPQAAVAAARQRIALESQLENENAQAAQKREADIANLRASVEQARFNSLTKEERIIELQKEAQRLRESNQQTDEQKLQAELRLLEIQKELQDSAQTPSVGGAPQVFADALQRAGGGGRSVVMGGGKDDVVKVNKDQLAELKLIKQKLDNLQGGVA
jgi:hypothetical protein